MMDYWNQSSTATKVIVLAALAAVACGAAVLCVLGLGLFESFQLPGSATPTPQVAPVNISRVTGLVVVVPTPAPDSPSGAVVCRVDILSGPGAEYERIGVLEEGTMAEVTGVSQDGTWYVIKLSQAIATQGWVSAQCLVVQGDENVGVVPPPPTPVPTPPPPVVITGWKGEYFNNRDLQGEPVLVQDDPEINFDWGTGSPGPDVPADNFSARWTISRDLPAGDYRFSIWVDDGVRMWIDDVLIIDGWVEGSTRNYVADVNLAAGTHTGRVEYFEAVGNAMITLNTSTGQPPPSTPGPPQAVISGPTTAQVGQPVAFTAQNSSVAPGSYLTAFNWNLGDGNLAQGVNVVHIYTNPGNYQVSLAVTDNQGLSSNATQAINIVAAPATATVPPTQPPQGPDAVINAPSQGVVGQPVTFDGSGSTGPNPIVSYNWAFGDGTTADAVTVQKTYSAAGIYNVTLEVTDDQGLSNSDTWQITIVQAPPPGATDTPVPAATDTPVPQATDTPVPAATDTPVPQATNTPVPAATDTPVPQATNTPVPQATNTPVPEQTPPSATLGVSPPSPVQVGQAVTFDASGSQPGSGAITGYQWDFGDGNSATGGAQQTHQYSAAGTFTATVTVVDENALSSSASQQVQVVAQ